MVNIGFDDFGGGKMFKLLFLPCSKLPEMTASPPHSALCCQGGAGDPASLITAPEGDGEEGLGGSSTRKEQS